MSQNGELKFFVNNPFGKGDVTGGIETELQTCVIGSRDNVDLPLHIRNSSYYKNLHKRTKNGEYSPKKLQELDKFLNENRDNTWENSYVYFKDRYLNNFAKSVLDHDLLSDKSDPLSGKRSDIEKLIFYKNGEKYWRFPVSYFLKISFANYIGEDNILNQPSKNILKKLLDRFSNDNTSPEVISFYVVSETENFADNLAKENCKRFLFTQLLTIYGIKKFKLEEEGERVMVYHSPLTPLRQKRLNELIPDSLYRELFISPCLSGWDRGEEKKRYMELCHLSLSRSYLNTIGKLKDVGIIKNNLIILPNTSNTCLTNNGIHISIGSKLITDKVKSSNTRFYTIAEKHYSDLVIKIVEHFIPLIIQNYSASPYRIPFRDLHPEKILGFLPHELDFTHIRMLYRRWMKKCFNKRFGKRFYPFGPLWIDNTIEKIFNLKGDTVPDFRLIDYFVALMSTDNSPAFDGTLNNHAKLKKELHEMGVFDEKLSFYTLFRGRSVNENGYNGFEGRFYSCFYDLREDTKHVSNLQWLFIALAYKLILSGSITHQEIPDDPFVESERRQLVFAAAIGIPTVYIKKDTKNILIRSIISHCKNTRISKRYPEYIRVELKDYLNAVINFIIKEGKDLLEGLDIKDTIDDVTDRVNGIKKSTYIRMIELILESHNVKYPIDIDADLFNRELESFYRNELRIKHIKDGFKALLDDISLKMNDSNRLSKYSEKISQFSQIYHTIKSSENKVIDESIDLTTLKELISIMAIDFISELEKDHRGEVCSIAI
ncbi:MAG: hypothetical protein ACP5LO_06770 [Calditerrivibrio sp.]|uniref:hypothetical protein n=1 Tax=Calditerrivibrio sp. TaxID=2792612 RepID=UPI003D0992FF